MNYLIKFLLKIAGAAFLGGSAVKLAKNGTKNLKNATAEKQK